MGIYQAECSQCKKPFQWFSSSSDTRCSDCRITNVVDPHTKYINEYYENKVQEIEKERNELKAEVERLNGELDRVIGHDDTSKV